MWRAGPPVSRRPVQWPRMSRCGLRTAASIRRVIRSDSSRSPLWTEPTTTSSRASRSSSWSREPSARMSTSMPVRMRNPSGRAALISATRSSCRRSRSAVSPRATVSRGEWSVRTRYSWPSRTAASAISSIGDPPSDQSECEWQSPRSADRIRAVSPSRSTPSVASRRRRYTGASPASDSATQRAVTSPTPLSLVNVPSAARRAISSAGRAASASAADRKARTR
jgi:hypothetical protein